jgi:hypothetical protein
VAPKFAPRRPAPAAPAPRADLLKLALERAAAGHPSEAFRRWAERLLAGDRPAKKAKEKPAGEEPGA